MQVPADVREPHGHDRVVQAHHEQAHAADAEHETAAAAADSSLADSSLARGGLARGGLARGGLAGAGADGQPWVGLRGGGTRLTRGELETQDGRRLPFW